MSWFSAKPKPLSAVEPVLNITKNGVAANNAKYRQAMKNRMVSKLPTGNLGSNMGKMITYKNRVYGVNRFTMGNTRNLNTWKANHRALNAATAKGGKTRRRRNRKNRK